MYGTLNRVYRVGCFTNYFSIHTQVHKDKNTPSDRIRTHFAKKKRVFAVKDGRVDNYRNEFCLACNVSEVSSSRCRLQSVVTADLTPIHLKSCTTRRRTLCQWQLTLRGSQRLSEFELVKLNFWGFKWVQESLSSLFSCICTSCRLLLSPVIMLFAFNIFMTSNPG